MAGLKVCLPMRQEQLDIGGSKIADRSITNPVIEATKRVRVLQSSRGRATTSAEIAVEALEELLGGAPDSGAIGALLICLYYRQ